MLACLEEDGLNDSQETIPFSYDMPYRIGWDPQSSEITESESECEVEAEDAVPELYSHKFIPDKDPAPFSSSFVEEEDEGEEEEADVAVGEQALTDEATGNNDQSEVYILVQSFVRPSVCPSRVSKKKSFNICN